MFRPLLNAVCASLVISIFVGAETAIPGATASMGLPP